MKVKALKDSGGNTLATAELAFNGAFVEPQADEGNRIEEMEVPEDYILNVEKFYKAKTK